MRNEFKVTIDRTVEPFTADPEPDFYRYTLNAYGPEQPADWNASHIVRDGLGTARVYARDAAHAETIAKQFAAFLSANGSTVDYVAVEMPIGERIRQKEDARNAATDPHAPGTWRRYRATYAIGGVFSGIQKTFDAQSEEHAREQAGGYMTRKRRSNGKFRLMDGYDLILLPLDEQPEGKPHTPQTI